MTDEDYDILKDQIPWICRGCESEFFVILAEDMLHTRTEFCPFCSEPMLD